MNRQMQGFVDYVRTEMLTRMQQAAPTPGLVALRRPFGVASREPAPHGTGRKKVS
jgi:MerR family transcriptional regulator/heat shock protein HspR